MGLPASQALTRFALFKDVPLAEIDAARPELHRQNFRSGQIVLEQGDDSRDVYFLSSGRLLAVLWTEDGKELVYASTPIGGHLGEIAALDGGDRSLTVYAMRAAEVMILKQASFMQLFETSPSFRKNVLHSLTGRIRDLTAQRFELVNFNVSQRVRTFIARLALEAGVFQKGGTLRPAPTHAEISNSIGANREAVSRAISQMTKDGVIEASRQSVTLLDIDTLIDGLDGSLNTPS